MFNTLDHVTGAAGVRIRRFYLSVNNNPDISFLNPNLGVGGASNIETLAKKGIQSILDLRDETEDNPDELKKYKINYLRIKIPDRSIPSLSDAKKGTDWIKSNIEQNNKVFIHCNLGRGRGPLFAILYLISQGKDKDEAIKYVKKIRKYAFLNKNQLNLIHEFQNYISKE